MENRPQIAAAPAASSFGKKSGRSRARPLLTAVAALTAIALGGTEARAEEPAVRHPSFVFEPLYASNQGSVHGIYTAERADLILVEGGFDAGFRTGMVCRVQEEADAVAEVMLVDVRENCAAAIILQLEPGKVIEAGHSVRIKTVKF